MLINISNLKKGIYIKIKNNYYKVIEFLHVKPGKGNAFVRTKIKNLKNGNIITNNFSSGSKIKKIEIESKYYTYLYNKNNNFFFINKQNYNQIVLSKNFIGKNNVSFLKENDNVIINFIKDQPLSLKINKYVFLKVKNTKYINNKNYKQSILETGIIIYTPLFIKKGDIIKINTKTKKYIERINRD
ncbi:elongation factor P [Candidatus Shikimatogenerans bostrichidophilus]|uniref:elongation factor P n=1 Tax=Candidatus Shikimatogenerans bostrichidophilus TaxID=2943807 RepID=UPI0029667436